MLKRNHNFNRFLLTMAMTLIFLIMTACATGYEKVEIPFNTEISVDDVQISSSMIEEGRILISLGSSSSDEYELSIRLARRPVVGYEYGNTRTSYPNIDGIFAIDGNWNSHSSVLQIEEQRDVSILMKNSYEVTRSFTTTIVVKMTSEVAKYETRIKIDDTDWFTDPAYLRSINRVDYWHPRIIEENKQKYLDHVEQ